MKYPEWYHKNAKLCAYIEELAAKDSFAILLTGKPGCGKTAIAEIMFDSILRHGEQMSYIYNTANAMYSDYLRAMALTGKERTEAVAKAESYMTYDLVLLDDLGCEMDTVASSAYFSRMFCIQYDALKEGKKLRCIVTTNLTKEGIATAYGTRVMDRIAEFYHIVTMTNESWRMKNIKEVRF